MAATSGSFQKRFPRRWMASRARSSGPSRGCPSSAAATLPPAEGRPRRPAPAARQVALLGGGDTRVDSTQLVGALARELRLDVRARLIGDCAVEDGSLGRESLTHLLQRLRRELAHARGGARRAEAHRVSVTHRMVLATAPARAKVAELLQLGLQAVEAQRAPKPLRRHGRARRQPEPDPRCSAGGCRRLDAASPPSPSCSSANVTKVGEEAREEAATAPALAADSVLSPWRIDGRERGRGGRGEAFELEDEAELRTPLVAVSSLRSDSARSARTALVGGSVLDQIRIHRVARITATAAAPLSPPAAPPPPPPRLPAASSEWTGPGST